MTMSVLGYMIGKDSEDSLKYNDFKFFIVGNMYKTEVNGNSIYFNYNPLQIESIEIEDSIIEKLKNSVQIDTTSGVNSSYKESIALAQFELVNYLSSNNQFLRTGFTTENEFNLPVITCLDSSESVPVLMFEKSNETKIYSEGNCIILNARSENDFLALKDRILYGVFGII